MDTVTNRVWYPPEGVTRHAGTPIPEDLEFFAAPPPEIGAVITANSTLTPALQPMPTAKRIGISVGIGVGIVAIAWAGLRLLSINLNPVVGAIILLSAAGLAYLTFGFSAICSFVGERGVADFTIKGSRTATPVTQMLLFSDSGQLYTSQTQRYKNGAYQGTNYLYRWTRRNSPAYEISGTHFSREGWPKENDNWHFASSSEIAWTSYLLQFANQDLHQRGYVEFPMAGNLQAVRVGQGFLEFVTKSGETQQTTVADMKDTKLFQGQFQFNHKDARWWSGKGKYSFPYATMPNARLFLLCLQQIAGITLN